MWLNNHCSDNVDRIIIIFSLTSFVFQSYQSCKRFRVALGELSLIVSSFFLNHPGLKIDIILIIFMLVTIISHKEWFLNFQLLYESFLIMCLRMKHHGWQNQYAFSKLFHVHFFHKNWFLYCRNAVDPIEMCKVKFLELEYWYFENNPILACDFH